MSEAIYEEELPNCEGVIWTTVEPSIVEPTGKHRFTIILCHGRGSNGRNFQDEVFESTSSSGLTIREGFPSVRWVFPSAGLPFDPRKSVQDEAHWFAMSSLKDPHQEQIRQRYGISQSIKYLQPIIHREIERIHGKASRVILGGMSQGCAVAIHALLSSQHRLNSFVGFCSWLPFIDLVTDAWDGRDENVSNLRNYYQQVLQIDIPQGLNEYLPAQTPCFLSHNYDDDVVHISLGRLQRDALRLIGMRVTWDEHDHGNQELKHWIHEPEGIDNLIRFLEERMGLFKVGEEGYLQGSVSESQSR